MTAVPLYRTWGKQEEVVVPRAKNRGVFMVSAMTLLITSFLACSVTCHQEDSGPQPPPAILPENNPTTPRKSAIEGVGDMSSKGRDTTATTAGATGETNTAGHHRGVQPLLSCSVSTFCSNHATSATIVPTVGGGHKCQCLCKNQWRGEQCGTCPLQFDPEHDCGACNAAGGYTGGGGGGGGGYPNCLQEGKQAQQSTTDENHRNVIAQDFPCTVAVNCNNHASSVQGRTGTGCHCDCLNQWHGLQCGTCDLQYDPNNCDACAPGYIGNYPNCVPPGTPTDPPPAASSASTSTTSGSSSKPRHDNNSDDDNKNNNNNSVMTIGAIAIGASVVALMLLSWIVWAHYKSRNDTSKRFAEEHALLLSRGKEQNNHDNQVMLNADGRGGGGNSPMKPDPTIVGGKYVLITELGRGSFGVVYLVRAVGPRRSSTPLVVQQPVSQATTTTTTTTTAAHHRRDNNTTPPLPPPPSPPLPPQQGGGGGGREAEVVDNCSRSTSPLQQTPGDAPINGSIAQDGGDSARGGATSTPTGGGGEEEEEDEEVFAMKVVKCRDDADLMKGVGEFRAMRTLQGHDGVVRLLDMFIVWDASGPSSLTTSNTNVSAFLKSPNCKSRNMTGGGGMFSNEFGGTDTDMMLGDAARRELCIVMKYYNAGTLQSAISAQPELFGGAEMIESFLRQVLSTLEHTHEHNIIHRDIKPANVLLDFSSSEDGDNGNNERETGGRPKFILSDFGLARPLEDTESTRAAGTLFFLSPEQLSYKVSKKSDVWATACVCILMAACRRKAMGKLTEKTHDKRAIWMRRSDRDFESSLKKAELADLPKWLTQLILKMLAEELNDRYSVAKCLQKLKEVDEKGGKKKK